MVIENAGHNDAIYAMALEQRNHLAAALIAVHEIRRMRKRYGATPGFWVLRLCGARKRWGM